MNQPAAEGIFWIAALACIIGELMILRSSFAVPRTNQSELVPESSRRGDLVWAVIPAIGLVALLFFTWRRVDTRNAHMRTMHESEMSMPGMDTR
jgi:heme/copper-type cytochrome/quinol oxidase subunit 2